MVQLEAIVSSASPITALSHIHFTGIKGVGMASLALCAQDLGIKVTGSDVEEEFITDETLARRGIGWKVGFSAENLQPRPDLVVTTGAHGGLQNPEVAAAAKQGIPVMTHAQALGEFAKDKDTIAVCGVGGKTTTASMIAALLATAGRHPSFAIGVGDIFSLGTPGRYDEEGKEFICEADEFAISAGVDNRPRWSYLLPKVIVVTNIEHDHPDIYPTRQDTKRVFREFFERVQADGLLVACIDNPNIAEILQGTALPVQTYGFSKEADWQIADLRVENQESKFSLLGSDEKYELILKVPGRFNVANAAAAFVVSQFLGVSAAEAISGVGRYIGCKRRVEKVGEKDGVLYWDDYAHHPTEIIAVLGAFRDWFPERRIVVVFQPHTYSRTKALFEEFAKSFENADVVVVADIYSSARETNTLGVGSKKLAAEIAKHHSTVHYHPDLQDVAQMIKKHAIPGDIVVTMGAGDIYKVHSLVLPEVST